MGISEFIIEVATNRIVISCLAAMVIAQAVKFLAHWIKEGKLDICVLLFEAGGMPSSHASSVSALAASVYLEQGVSALFIVASVFAIVVMRDAAGIRWASGQQSKLLNRLVKIIKINERYGDKIGYVKELAGHTPTQVLIGMLLGIGCSMIVYWLV